jgi:RNA recognition motif. (a.k.a. RRM, RBD, or RNP domain)
MPGHFGPPIHMHSNMMPTMGMMPPRPDGMNFPPLMPFSFPSFPGAAPFGMQGPQKSNEMIFSNVHFYITDQMIYQLLEKYNPKYVTRKISRGGKAYFRVGFNQPKEAEAVEREFKYKNISGHYLKVLWANKAFPEISNSIVLKNIKEGIEPKMIDDLLTRNGFKIFIIHFPTSAVENSPSVSGAPIGSEYKPNGYAFIQLRTRESPEDKSPEDAIRLLDGYSFPSMPDVKLIAQKFDPGVKDKKKERDVLYCTGFPADVAAKSEEEITKYLLGTVLEGIINSEDDVSIRVYKKANLYATMKFNDSALAANVQKNFSNENGTQEEGSLVVRYIKSKNEFSKEYKEGEMHKKCIFIKNLKSETSLEELTSIVSSLEGFDRVIFFRQNDHLNRKYAAVSFKSDKEAQEAISKIKAIPKFKALEEARGPGESSAPTVTILFTKAQKAKWENMKKNTQMVRNTFNPIRFMPPHQDPRMMMGPQGPQMSMMPPMGYQGGQFRQAPRGYRGPMPPMNQPMGPGGVPMGPRQGFNPAMRGQGPFRGGPRHFGGPQPHHFQHHQQPEPQAPAPLTWEEELMNLQEKLKGSLMADLKAACKSKSITDVRAMVASEVIRIFASYLNRRSDSTDVKKCMLQFLEHIEAEEDLDILLSDTSEWKESMDFIWSEINGKKEESDK